jgi:formylglycine-generating enzyme required for sulfatase activity/serine/threonine protein kinase
LPADTPRELCPKCLAEAAVSKTVTHGPATRSEAADPGTTRSLDLAEFRQVIVDLGLIDAEELARFAVRPDEVLRLANALVRAGKLTGYQAAAITQGKARGLSIGSYLVLDKLGQGGMGVVFKARHRPTGHVVAMKILPPSFGRNPQAVERFRREVEIAGRLDHPNVVSAFDTGAAQGVHYLAMEYVSGHDLDRLVADGGPLPVDLALHCTIHAARGLAAAHAQGIIHRDVKPGNMMLDEKSSVRVLDLGLARVVEAGSLMGDSPVGSLTQSGAYMGTVDFMAPEQADDPRKVDNRADIYSLGCTLDFLLTARPPFLGDTILKRIMAHQGQPAPSLCAARSEVSEQLEAAYMAMMAKRPAERPDSMGDVIELLEACRSQPENDEEARSALTVFARRAFKRASPRGRDRGPDASIFARHAQTEGLQFDPDLRLEDVVMDLREEAHPEPLPEAKLPPIVPWPLPNRVRRRRSAFHYGWIGFALFGLAALLYVLKPGAAPDPAAAPAAAQGTAASPTSIRTVPAKRRAPDDLVRGLDDSWSRFQARDLGLPDLAGSAPTPAPAAPVLSQRRLAEWTSPSSAMVFVRIEGGEFMMGSTDDDGDASYDEKPQHTLRIRSFGLGKTEVTQEQYRVVMGFNPSWFSASGGGNDKVAGQSTHRHPVESVSWLDAIRFCNALSTKDGLVPYYDDLGSSELPDVGVRDPAGASYRLPTEAEWEYACRAHAGTIYPFGDNSSGLWEHAWHRGNSGNVTHPVGEKRPNAFGLYDMQGNVWEWCWDWYEANYYGQSPGVDPRGPLWSSHGARSLRSAGWDDTPGNLRSAARGRNRPDLRKSNVGLRVARNLPSG